VKSDRPAQAPHSVQCEGGSAEGPHVRHQALGTVVSRFNSCPVHHPASSAGKQKGAIMRKFYTALALAGALIIAGLGLAQSATAALATSAAINAQAVRTAKFGLTPAGVMVPLNADAVQTGYNPIRSATAYRFYFGSNNPERALCIKDHTPESDASWIARWTATDWSNASPKFFMVWDDMNANGGYGESNCISYDGTQTVQLYSYGSTTDGYCGTVDISYNVNNWIVGATAWLNRLADNGSCRATQTLRQNVVGALVGNILGLLWHNNGNDSIMSTAYAMRSTNANPQYSDIEALGRVFANS
jgi:hypothetical protein